MSNYNLKYRKNQGILMAFLLLVTVLFVISAYFARTLTVNFVETDFNNKKVEIFDETIEQFNEFFTQRIPEISYYQGYIDSIQGLNMSNIFLRKYPFISHVTFYDLSFTNKDSIGEGLKAKQLSILVKSKIGYSLNDEHKMVVNNHLRNEPSKISEDFNTMILKLVSYLDQTTDSTQFANLDLFKVFYGVQAGRVSYLNIPRTNDLITYRMMMNDAILPQVSYNQDLFVFDIDPKNLKVTNKYPKLYEHISVKPIIDQTVVEAPYLATDVPLPGALSEYKLQFESSDKFILKAINKQFFPVMSGLVVVYLLLLSFVYLIYRNVHINSRLYQLQYDFINNLTHEFKTPVSVIKIAGNNIKSADKITDKERAMYGRILDQEADKLNNLMNKLLSFAQIENKSIKFKGERIDINEFCQRIIDATQLKYPDFKMSLTSNATGEMYVDPVLLGSVFQNLVDNAYKYSPVDRKILEIKIEQNKKNFVIVFKDQGIGIDKKEFSSIFKKFYRVKNQFNQQGSIGLGLAFCKEITAFMGGEIKVDSQIGIGTVFTLIFPIGSK